MTRLHIQPQVRPVATQLAESHRHVGGHRRMTFHHPIQRLAANSQQHRDLTDGAPLSPKLRQNIALEKDARMHGWPGDLVPLNNKFLGQSYYLKILVILFQINSESSRRIPFERDAPRSVHMDAMANWLSFQRVQIEAWKIKILQIVRSFQSVQHVSASLSQPGIDLRATSGYVEILQSLVPEALDHVHNVAPRVSSVKSNVTSRRRYPAALDIYLTGIPVKRWKRWCAGGIRAQIRIPIFC
jgi:hypothetical protein